MKKSKKMILALMIVVLLILVTMGMTVAFLSYKSEGKTLNTISSGGITFHYKELKGKGHGISITNAMPTDNDAAKISNEYFDFKITSSTTDGIRIPYVVTARMDNNSDSIMGDIIDIYLTEVKNNVETPTKLFSNELVKYNELDDYENRGNYIEKVIYTDKVRTSDYEKNFRLRMWIDGNTNLNTGSGQSSYNNKTFSITVNVNALGETGVEPDGPSPDPNDPTIPSDATCTGGYYGLQCSCDNRWIAWSDGDNYLDSSNNPLDKTRTNDKNYPPANTYSCSCGSETGYVVNTKQLFGQLCTSPTITGRLNRLVLSDNEIKTNPTLTTTASDAEEAGLYRIDTIYGYGGTTNPGTTYCFRGNINNNIVEFAGITWRIVRINEDGTVRLISSTRVNNSLYTFSDTSNPYYSETGDIGSGTYPNIKYGVDTWYNENIGNNSNYASKIASGNYFCEAARVKRAGGEAMKNGMPQVGSDVYIPDLRCLSDVNGHSYVNEPIALLTYDEALIAGTRVEKADYTYYLYNGGAASDGDKNYFWWTMSPAGSFRFYASTVEDWGIHTGILYGFRTNSNYNYLRPVINLKSDVIATKDENGHYIVN